jgi:hypothetical protein
MILVLVAIAASAFAIDYDGYDWMTWSAGDKIMYVLGFYSALEEIGAMMVHYGVDPQVAAQMTFIPHSVGDMVNMLDDYYWDDRAHLRYGVQKTVLWLNGLDYWNEEPIPPVSGGDRT